METQRVPSLDRPADTFARILQGAAAELEPAARGSAAGQILYHVGRWIYLTDAFDDLEEDQARGNYNPLLLRYGPQVQKEPEALRETLHVSLGLADTACPAGLGGLGEPAGPHPVHGPSCGRGGRLQRDLEAAKQDKKGQHSAPGPAWGRGRIRRQTL